MFSTKIKQTNSQKNEFGTTKSNWKTDLFLNPSKTTIWHRFVMIFIPSHTLFLWTILWTVSYRNNNLLILILSDLLIIFLDHILSDRWSYVSIHILRHVLDAYFGYYLHALDMCYTWLTSAIHFRCCTSHGCSMFYIWLMHVCLAAYMLILLYKPSIDDCTL